MQLRAGCMWPLLLVGLSLFGLVAAQGYDFGQDVTSLVKRQDKGRIVVTGAPRVNGTNPFRLEIRDLQEDSHKWTLYILALSYMQYMDQNDELSWYQLAGTLDNGHSILEQPSNSSANAYLQVSMVCPGRSGMGSRRFLATRRMDIACT